MSEFTSSELFSGCDGKSKSLFIPIEVNVGENVQGVYNVTGTGDVNITDQLEHLHKKQKLSFDDTESVNLLTGDSLDTLSEDEYLMTDNICVCSTPRVPLDPILNDCHVLQPLSSLSIYSDKKKGTNRAKRRCRICGTHCSFYCEKCSDLPNGKIVAYCNPFAVTHKPCYFKHLLPPAVSRSYKRSQSTLNY